MAEQLAREARGEPPQSSYLQMLDRLQSEAASGRKQQLQRQRRDAQLIDTGRLLRPSSAYVRQGGDPSSPPTAARPPLPPHIAALVERQQAQQAQMSGGHPDPAWVQQEAARLRLWHMCARPEARHTL